MWAHEDSEQTLTSRLQTISDNVLSLGQLLRNGFVFNLRRGNDSVMYHPEQLEKSCGPDCTSCESGDGGRHACATVWSIPLRLLDRRLDELALPKHGTKLDKWTRNEKRENEFMRERKSQAAIEPEREAGLEGRRREAAIPISDPRELATPQRRKFTSSLICHHGHGANSASEEEVRRILTRRSRSNERNPHFLLLHLTSASSRPLEYHC